MDLKSDDLINIEIDPAIELSYGIEGINLNDILGEVSNNYFDSNAETYRDPSAEDDRDPSAEDDRDSSAEDDRDPRAEDDRDPSAEDDRDSGSENEEDSGSENIVSPQYKKVNETVDCKCSVESSAKSFAEVDKLNCVDALQEKGEKVQVEASSRKTKRKKDINGNEELPQDEILNDLLLKLELSDSKVELSDSDNEEQDKESTALRERGPVRPQRKAHRNRNQNCNWNKTDVYDRAQFNPERLKFWSGGSNQIQSNEAAASDQLACHDSLTASFSGSHCASFLPNQDSSYEDARAVSVRSPESGYDSSSASITGSPPRLPVPQSYNLDFIPETDDEQIILDFVLEHTDSALTDNLSVCNIDEKDAKDKIYSFLVQDIPAEAQNSSDAVVPNDDVSNHVPSPNSSGDLSIDCVLFPPVLSNSVPKSIDSTKRIAPSKLNDKAKRILREFLSKDEFYDVAKRIYNKVADDEANKKKCEVIYVENDDKTSELRTNLHYAVLNNKIEDIYCLVEIHKQYGYSLGVINNRDKYGKTALDYAIENKMTLVVDYLRENHGIQSIKLSQ